MAELTIPDLRALLDANTVADAPIGSTATTGSRGEHWTRTSYVVDTAWWNDDADEDDGWTTTAEVDAAGARLTGVTVPVEQLWELLEAHDEAARLREENARLASPVAMTEIKTALATWVDDNDAAPPADVMGGVLDEFLAGRRGAVRG